MSSYPPHIEALRVEAQRVTLESWAIRARLSLSKGIERFGPCPVCGGKDRFSINTKKNAWNCRGCEKGGRDVIGLVMHQHRIEFIPALELITGRSAKDLKGEDPAAKARRQQQLEKQRRDAEAEQIRRDRAANTYREWARGQGYKIWQSGQNWRGRMDEKLTQYFERRGIVWILPLPGLHNLRWLENHSYVKKLGGKNVQLHCGPAMLARVYLPGGKFGAVHQTWIDLSQPNGKAVITQPDGGKVPSKIVRGSKKGGAILLHTPKGATRLVAGEGIETTLSVMVASFEPDTAYWSLVDLGNMAGRAARGSDGRVINDQPDMEDKDAFVPPEWVREMVFLGDADADTEAKYQKTRGDLTRGARRAMINRPGLQAFIAMADRGKDFNDMVREQIDGRVGDGKKTT